MRFSTTPSVTALALFGRLGASHMILANPVPYGSDVITNSPLSSSGADFPCQVSGSASTFYATSGGISNTVTAGESLTMSFKGSAVHGGGSCQVALSTDMQPSQSTRWSVILSIEGGCPSKDGSGPSTYAVKIPADVPAGDYSYAWTWTSKESGTQEYYMNCAPLTVKAASGSKKGRFSAGVKKSLAARADALTTSYPPLAVYNLAGLNSCKSELSSSPRYPYPGRTVEHLAASSPAYANISGSDCFAKGVSWSGPSSSSSSSSTSSSDATSDITTSGKGIDSTSAASLSIGSPSRVLVAVVAALAGAVVTVSAT